MQCRKTIVATVGCAVLLLTVGGCGERERRTEKATIEGVLLVGNGAEPQELDPHLVSGVPEHRILSALFEGLVDLDPETLEPIPGTAERWRISPDGTVYTFYLREDARWSNGEPVTAQDFLYAWERILTPALASEYASMLHCVENARAFNTGEITDFAKVGVKALDDRTLEVRLEHPTPYFLSLHIHYTWYPVPRKVIEARGGMTARDTKWTQPEHMVSNGAFRLVEWEPDKVIRVEKNPHYWNADEVRLQALAFYPIEDAMTEDRTFRTGGLHLTENIPLPKIEIYQKEDYPYLHIDPYLGTYYYRLNTTKPPFDDKRVRLAFALSLDRDTLVGQVVKAGRWPAYHYVPPDTGGYTSNTRVPHNVKEARRLLAEAGYPNGKGFPNVELLYNTSDDHKRIAEAVQQMWKEALGVEVQLLNQDWKVYLDSMNTLNYNIARSGWIADYNDPYNFLECFLSDNGNNRTGYASPEYDRLVQKAASTLHKAGRLATYQQAEARLLDDAPIIPIYFYTRPYLKSPDVKNWQPNQLGYISWKTLYLEPSEKPDQAP
ncbi:MAG: peptide ABC transporter substrate-binding protein [Candidatus Hydrogenedentota bacterium]